MRDLDAVPHRRLYGRRKGRPLRVRKSTLMRTLLPQLQITLPESGRSDPAHWFDFAPEEIWLEIGFGGGEHLAAQAVQHPNAVLLGCEPFANGVASLLDHIEQENLRNIRIYPGDARLLLAALPDGCLSRVYILFADPWPKKRHAERRFVQPDSLQEIARVLRPGGWLRLATDDPTLQAWTKEQLSHATAFIPDPGISLNRPDDWVVTRYEEKALAAGRTPIYYGFRRK